MQPMARQHPGFLHGVSADTRRYVRELKNKVYNYTEMEQMVREATCNDPSPPSPALMREIAKGTFTVEFPAIMTLIWKRIKDKTNENHPMKCLILLEFILREGNADMVNKQIQKNLPYVDQLRHFTLYNDKQQDIGGAVRDKAEAFLKFLRDGDPTTDEPKRKEKLEEEELPVEAATAPPNLLGDDDPFGASDRSSGFGDRSSGYDDPFGNSERSEGSVAFNIASARVPAGASQPVMKLSGPAQPGRSRRDASNTSKGVPKDGPIAPVRRSTDRGSAQRSSTGGDPLGMASPQSQPSPQATQAFQQPQDDVFGNGVDPFAQPAHPAPGGLFDSNPVAQVDNLSALGGLSLGGQQAATPVIQQQAAVMGTGMGVVPQHPGTAMGGGVMPQPSPGGASASQQPSGTGAGGIMEQHPSPGIGGAVLAGATNPFANVPGQQPPAHQSAAMPTQMVAPHMMQALEPTAADRAKEATQEQYGEASSIVNLDNLTSTKQASAPAQQKKGAPAQPMSAMAKPGANNPPGGIAGCTAQPMAQPMAMGGPQTGGAQSQLMGMGGMVPPGGGSMGMMGGVPHVVSPTLGSGGMLPMGAPPPGMMQPQIGTGMHAGMSSAPIQGVMQPNQTAPGYQSGSGMGGSLI